MQGKTAVFLVVCVGLLLFVYRVGDRDLWAPDEDEYAQISREMIRTNNWLYPTCNGEPWTIKPPLYNWLVGLISIPYGDVNEFRARIFSSLAALGTCLLTFGMGRRLFSVRAGLLAALALGTSVLWLENGRWAQTYTLSVFFSTLAIDQFIRGYLNPEKRTGSYLLMYAAVGVGILSMGPVNAVVPGLVVLAYIIFSRDLKHVLRMKLIWGALIVAAIALPWYVAVALNEDYGSGVLVRTNLTRYFNTWTHHNPFYYYVLGLTWTFLPWSLFLPGALHLAYSKRSQEKRNELRYLLVWFLSLLIFFSIGQCKRQQYLLAAYPALALLVGYFGDRAINAWNEKYFRKNVVIPSLILAGLMAVVAVGVPIAVGIQFRPYLGLSLGLSALVGTFAMLLVLAWRKERPDALLFLPGAFVAALVVFGVHLVVPVLEDYKSPKPFCKEIAVRLEQGGDWAMFRFYRAAYVYYTDSFAKVIYSEKELKEFLDRPTFVMVAMEERHHKLLRDPELAALPIIARSEIGHRTLLLIANREDP